MEEHPSENFVALNPTEEQLFEAATTGNAEILRQISDPIFTAKQNPQGDTACHVALQQGHLDFAREIGKLHPPILYTPNVEGDTVLHCALKIRQPEFFVQAVNLIREYLGKNIKYTNKLPRKVNRLMLEARRCYNSSWDGEERSLVHLAAENGYFKAVKILLQTPALNGIDAPRRTDDDLSAVCYSWVMVRPFEMFLRMAIINSMTRRSTALHAAVRNGHYGIVQLLMQSNRSLIFVREEDGRTPMFIVVDLKLVKMCNLLLEEFRGHPFLIISSADHQLSPCHLAALNDDRLEIFQLFMARCPLCCFEENAEGQNVLHIAVQAGALGIVKFIMEHKKLRRWMIKDHDNDGYTPLSLATASGNEEMLNALLASPVNVDEVENVQQKGIENYHSCMLVMATLITTVTFAAAISLPGGYKSDDPNEGTAALIGSAAFRVFLVFDTASFLSSIISMALLIAFAGDPGSEKLGLAKVIILKDNGEPLDRKDNLKGAVTMLSWSLMLMLAAFGAGVWAVIGSECKWLTILIVVMTSVVIFAINPVVAAVLYTWEG